MTTGKKGSQNWLQEKNMWSQNWIRKKTRVSKMVTEIKWGLKYSYANKLGSQIF